MIGRARALERIEFDIDLLGDEALTLMTRAPRLRAIDVKIANATDAGVMALAAKKLERFNLAHAKHVSERAWQALLSNSQLKSVYFAGCPMSGACFEAVQGFPNLGVVQLHDLAGLTDRVFDSLATLPNLDCFVLETRGTAPQLTSAGVARFLQQRMPLDFEIDKKLIDDRVWALMVKKGWLYNPSGRPRFGWNTPRPRTAAEVDSLSLNETKISDAGSPSSPTV